MMATAPPDQPTRTVLVVDDDAVSRLVLARMLRNLGHAVVEAASLAEARECATAEPAIDLIVTDYCLPDGTGAELLADLRGGRPPTLGVLVTGVARFAPGAAPTAGAGPAAADAWLSKPVDSRALAACLRALPEGQAG